MLWADWIFFFSFCVHIGVLVFETEAHASSSPHMNNLCISAQFGKHAYAYFASAGCNASPRRRLNK